MAEKTNQSSDIFAKKIKNLEESSDPLKGINCSFDDEDHPLIIISHCNTDIHFSGHDNVRLKSQSILGDDQEDTIYPHSLKDADQQLIIIDDCNRDIQNNFPQNVPLKSQNIFENGNSISTNYSSSYAESSWPQLKKIVQLPQRGDESCPLECVHNDNMGGLNFSEPVAEEETAPSSEGASGSKPDHLRGIPDICWEDYKSFLFRVWEENSLENSSLDDESSTMPSISSFSGDVPYVLELLTKQKESLHLNKSTKAQPTIYGDNLMYSKQNKFPHLEERRNSSNINSQSFSILEKKFQPRPLAKETSTLQGEVSRRPSLVLRPNVLLESLEEGRSSLLKNQKVFEKPPNCFSKSHKISNNDSNNTNTIQNPTNKVVDTRIKMSLTKQQQNPVFKNYEAKSSLSQINQPHFNDRGQSVYHAGNLCYHRDEIQDIKMELERAQSRIASLSYKMEDQSSYLERLIEERDALQERLNVVLRPPSVIPEMTYPLYPQQGYKNPHLPMYPSGMESYSCNPHQSIGRRASWQYPCDLPRGRIPGGYKGTEELMTHLTRTDPIALADLRVRIMALQEQNFELNFFLKKEEQKRKEAEEAVRKEQQYVRKLQESIQDISSSTLVIDPLTYRQVADNYIASQKKPVRRTHTCNPYIGSSDLVCDSNRLQVAQNKTQSTSCPSSPLGSNHDRKASNSNTKLSSSVENHMQSSSPSCSRYTHQENKMTEPSPDIDWGLDVSGSSPPVSHHQYQELLSSLDGLQVSSSPS